MSDGKKWDNLGAKIDLSSGFLNLFVTCPLCGEQHLVDEPEEKREEWLYCDTHGKRVEFPNRIQNALKLVSEQIRQESGGQNRSTNVKLRMDNDGTPRIEYTEDI